MLALIFLPAHTQLIKLGRNGSHQQEDCSDVARYVGGLQELGATRRARNRSVFSMLRCADGVLTGVSKSHVSKEGED